MAEDSAEPQVLSLQQVRERVHARQKAAQVDVSKMPQFEHEGLGGKVRYYALSSGDAHRLNNPEQFFPLDHPEPALRGRKASTPAMDDRTREKTLLMGGVWTEDGKRLPEDVVEALMDDPFSGPDNLLLTREILDLTNKRQKDEEAGGAANAPGLVFAFSRWESAFHDLLVKTGWVAHWVEYVTARDDSTPEAREAARKLAKLEAAAPEWAKHLQSHEITEALAAEGE